MATVTGPDGREFDVDDSDSVLLSYYRAEGYVIDGVPTVDDFGDAAPAVESVSAPGLGIFQGPPVVLEQLPDGEDVVVGAPDEPAVDAPQPGPDADPAA